MRRRFVRAALGLSLMFVALGLAFYSCGSSEDEISTIHNGNYVGAGSFWFWNLSDDGTFTAEVRETRSGPASMSLNGTYVSYATGFYKFTVVAASGTDAPSAGDQAYGFSVPGVVLIVKPIGDDDSETLIMPALGTCPTEASQFNWVQAKTTDDEGDLSNEDIWGNASLPLTGGITGSSFNLAGTVDGPNTFATITSCADGIISLVDNEADPGFITTTSAGVGIVNSDETNSDDAIIALPRDTTVTAATLGGKNFVGLVFMENDGGGEVQPMNVSFVADGSSGTYTFLTDVETGATGETGPMELVEVGSGEKAGFVQLKANSDSDPERPTMWGAVVSDIGNSGRTFFFASGMSVPNDASPATHTFSVIVVEKP